MNSNTTGNKDTVFIHNVRNVTHSKEKEKLMIPKMA